MSALDCSPTRWLVEDVLLQIFQYLDGKDLLRCEAVCRQWRQVMLAGTPWRRWLNQRSPSPELRPFWQRARQNDSFQDYRAICRYILLLDYNWRRGKYETSSLTLNNVGEVITSGDYIYCFINEGNSHPMIILDKTFQVRTIGRMAFEGELLHCYKNMAIYVHLKKIKFVDCSVGHVISELPVEGYSSVMNCRFNGELLTVRFDGLVDNWLRVWRVENDYSTITLIKEINIICDRLLEMDDKYIVVRGRFDTDVYFICIKTLEVERTLYVGLEEIAYEQGLLFILGKKVIQIWDAASRTYLNDLDIHWDYAPYSDSGARIKANSKFLVVVFEGSWNLLCVYDLEALKKGSTKRLLLHKIDVPYSVHALSVDETHIVYCEYEMTSQRRFTRNEITALDFRPVDCRPIDPLYC
jgi:F-box-like